MTHDLEYHIELKEQLVHKNGNVIPNFATGFEWNPTQELTSRSSQNHLFTIIWYQKFEVSGGKVKFKNIFKLPTRQRLFFDVNPWSVYNNLNSNILGLNTIPVGTEGYQPKEKDLVVLGGKLRFKTENLQWNPLKNTSKPQIKKVLCIYVCKV